MGAYITPVQPLSLSPAMHAAHPRTEDDVGDEEGHGHGRVRLPVEDEVLHLEVAQEDGEHRQVHLCREKKREGKLALAMQCRKRGQLECPSLVTRTHRGRRAPAVGRAGVAVVLVALRRGPARGVDAEEDEEAGAEAEAWKERGWGWV